MTGSIDRDERLLRSAFCIIVLFMLAEAVGGLLANSLTLLADAAHMLLDASALGIAWILFEAVSRLRTAESMLPVCPDN